MINQTDFDVIKLSETWLKNDKHLLEYVRLPGYEFAFRNRDCRYSREKKNLHFLSAYLTNHVLKLTRKLNG